MKKFLPFILISAVFATACGGGGSLISSSGENPGNTSNPSITTSETIETSSQGSQGGVSSSEEREDKHTITAEEYAYQMNPETILFESSYMVHLIAPNDSVMHVQLDHGKLFNITFNTYYKLEKTANGARVTSYIVDSTTGKVEKNTRELSLDALYNYIFDDFIVLLKIPYSSWTYNQQTEKYTLSNIKLEGIELESGTMDIRYGYPQAINVSVKGFGECQISFESIGTIHINLPEELQVSSEVMVTSEVPQVSQEVVETSQVKQDVYTITAEEYAHELNPETVVFNSNYSIVMTDYMNRVMSIDLDNGKYLNKLNGLYFAFEKVNEKIMLTSYSPDGRGGYRISSELYDKESLFSYFFGSFQSLFYIPFTQWTFNATTNSYSLATLEYGGMKIIGGTLKVKNGKPMYMDVIIDGVGTSSLTFSNHGEVNINIPNDRYTFTEEELKNQLSPETIIFNSNYVIDMTDPSGSSMTILMDNELCYNPTYGVYTSCVRKDENTILMDLYTIGSDGTYVVQSREMNNSEIKGWFFGGMNFIFDIQYSQLTFNESDGSYSIAEFTVGNYHFINGEIRMINGLPFYLSLTVENLGSFTMKFSNHGKTNIVLPNVAK